MSKVSDLILNSTGMVQCATYAVVGVLAVTGVVSPVVAVATTVSLVFGSMIFRDMAMVLGYSKEDSCFFSLKNLLKTITVITITTLSITTLLNVTPVYVFGIAILAMLPSQTAVNMLFKSIKLLFLDEKKQFQHARDDLDKDEHHVDTPRPT